MKAILCKEFGPPEKLVLDEVPSPQPKAGELLLAVHACGLNFADTLIIQGLYQEKPPLPFSPGAEVAGEVLAVGKGVRGFVPGRRVVALASTGGFAEEVVVPAAVAMPLPDSMDYTTAASFTIAYGTSHVALEHRAKLQAGETLLVHGAAGGVGLTAVELGKLLGATVIATASTAEKLALAQQYGADHLINYTEEDFRARVKETTSGKGADVIFVPVGVDVFDQSMRCIAWNGRLLVIGFASGRIPKLPVNLTLVKNCSVVGVYWGRYAQKEPAVLLGSLQKLFSWHAQGRLKPPISHTFPLAQAGEALNTLIKRKAKGKVVLQVR